MSLALGAEKDWIIKKRPPFNVQHNLGHAELRSAHLEFRAQGGNAAELIPRVLPKRLPLAATRRLEGGGCCFLWSPPSHTDPTRGGRPLLCRSTLRP